MGWGIATADLLMPIYKRLSELVFDCSYLQVDESTIQSLENAPKGKSHRSFQWVYRNVEKGLILFDYQRGRDTESLHPKVKIHKGYLQSDGYKVYDALEVLHNIILVNCMAHARREFFEAKQNDPSRAETALGFIQQLYKIEDDIRKEALDGNKIVERRQKESLPILTKFKIWLEKELPQTLPQSPPEHSGVKPLPIRSSGGANSPCLPPIALSKLTIIASKMPFAPSLWVAKTISSSAPMKADKEPL
jgi:transposase